MEIELRADGNLHIEGYVNAVERDSRTVICPECGKCVEQIKAGAFEKALRAAKNIDMLLNHDKNRKLAATAAGTLKLIEDSVGLRASADITDKEVIEKAAAGRLRGWSFGFRKRVSSIEQRADNIPRRNIAELELLEVSIIDDRYTPCYAGTSIEIRAESEEICEIRYNPYHDPNDYNDYYEQFDKRIKIMEILGRSAKCGVFVPIAEELRGNGKNYTKNPETGLLTGSTKASSKALTKNNKSVRLDSKGMPFKYPTVNLPKKEYANVVSEIGRNWNTKYKEREFCELKFTNRTYYFENRGIGDYNIYRIKKGKGNE